QEPEDVRLPGVPEEQTGGGRGDEPEHCEAGERGRERQQEGSKRDVGVDVLEIRIDQKLEEGRRDAESEERNGELRRGLEGHEVPELLLGEEGGVEVQRCEEQAAGLEQHIANRVNAALTHQPRENAARAGLRR